MSDTQKIASWRFINFILFLLAILALNVYATQRAAAAFGYDISLGDPLIGNLYSPFSWIFWTIDLSPIQDNEDFFRTLHLQIAFGFFAIVAFFAFAKMIFGRKANLYKDVHGSARWATKKDIKKMGILDRDEGVYIGGWEEPRSNDIHYLRHNGPEHVIAFAPTRSGKGVGLVLPTLLSWRESCIILDIKGENWALTSGWRKNQAGNKVLKFDPSAADGESVKFNPLEEINLGSNTEVGEVQNIAMMIVDPDGKGLNDYWSKAGFTILVAFILHTLYKAKNEGYSPTLANIYKTINDPDKDIREVLDEMLYYKHKASEPHPVVAGAAREALNKADAELSGVIGTMSSNLGLYADPVISNNLSYSEFKISDLMNDKAPVSLYLVIKPKEMDRMRPLIRVILNQILRTLIDNLKFSGGANVKGYKHRLLLMLDEFTALGKLEIFEQALAYMAGYGIKSYIIIQDLMQLYKHYTKEESIISNCHVRIAYAPNKVETAELLSKMCGSTTVVKTVRTASGKRHGMVLDHISENYQEVQRPLLTVDECMTLPGLVEGPGGEIIESGDMLIFMAGRPAIYGKQILYFMDSEFTKRAKFEAPQESDSLLSKKEAQAKKIASTQVQKSDSTDVGGLKKMQKQKRISNARRR